jgi:hypothetical protein
MVLYVKPNNILPRAKLGSVVGLALSGTIELHFNFKPGQGFGFGAFCGTMCNPAACFGALA